MKTDVLIKLIEAGYTKEDIALMEEVEARPTEDAEGMPTPEEPKEETKEDPAPNETPDNAADKMTETINDIMQIITKMQKTLDGLQQKNAKNAESEAPAKMTADDVVRDFFGKTKKA